LNATDTAPQSGNLTRNGVEPCKKEPEKARHNSTAGSIRRLLLRNNLRVEVCVLWERNGADLGIP